MMISELELEEIVEMITARIGIIPRSSHRKGIRDYLERKLSSMNADFATYKRLLVSDSDIFSELVDESTVNETYFFREERQFRFVRDKLLPIWKANFGSVPIKIWSAACSFGEEAYSLALLAKDAGIRADITASDINSRVLRHCESGVFLSKSIRSVDGCSFMNLLRPYTKEGGKIEFGSEIRSCIKTRKLNLAEIDSPFSDALLPHGQNIVFLRNVFIYFSQDLRARILRAISEKCMAPGGCLFVSMSEIAQLDATVMPDSFDKISDGSVFYFRKKGGA